jgi:serine/threonine protein kinase
VFEKVLGRGAYKTVYLVSRKDPSDGNLVYYALAVEKLRNKAGVKDGLRGIRIAEQLQRLEEEGHDYFESIEGWWFQSSGLPELVPNASVFPHLEDRTRKIPSRNFLGTKWLVALKPVYDMDLRAFVQHSPKRYTVGETSRKPDTVAGIPLTEASAVQLVLECCHAGRLMHAAGLVHRDIKPKNIMLLRGHPVIIDFGFSEFVDTDSTTNRLCIVQPGKVKGDLGYVLARDAAVFQGCAEGDVYAMGKTMYEVLFGPTRREKGSSHSSSSSSTSSSSSSSPSLNEANARVQNAKFRALLESENAGKRSRFVMSGDVRIELLDVVRGMCREEQPLSFAEAEALIHTSTQAAAGMLTKNG